MPKTKITFCLPNLIQSKYEQEIKINLPEGYNIEDDPEQIISERYIQWIFDNGGFWYGD